MSKTVKCPVTGIVNQILRKPGEPVKPAEPVIIVESMKMHIEVCGGSEGVVAEIFVREGDAVEEGEPLLTLRETQ